MEIRISNSLSPAPIQRIRPDAFVMLALMAALNAGCATQVIPPANPIDPVTVYLTDYGKHASVLLPSPEGGYDEYAFGDWDYFALGKTAFPVAIRALLGSPQSTLGRRHIPVPSEGHTLQSELGADRLQEFDAPEARVDALRIQLDTRFRHDGDSAFHSDYSGLYHVRDEEHYWLGNNCNHVAAAWLRQLGCEIRGPAILSNFFVTPARHDKSQ